MFEDYKLNKNAVIIVGVIILFFVTLYIIVWFH